MRREPSWNSSCSSRTTKASAWESVWHRDYRREEVAAGSKGAEVLDAWNRGLASIMQEAEAEIGQAFRTAE